MTFKEHVFRSFCGMDNQTIDLGRVLWAKGSVVFTGLSIFHVWKTGSFDYIAFASGFGAILAAGGAALWAKAKTEPGSGPS